MRRHLLVPVLLTLAAVAGAPSAHALEGAPIPPGVETTIPDYAVWIPDGVPFVRGIIAVSNHEAGADIYRDRQTYGAMRGKSLGYRDLAARLGLALFLFRRFGANNYVEDQQRQITDALAMLATKSGHPELRDAGLIPTGLSAGGFYAAWLARYRIERVIGFFPIAGTETGLSATPAWRKIPALFINQGRDGFYPGSGVHTLREALAGRKAGSLFGGLITPPDVEHHNIYKHDFVLVWLEDVVRLRVPAALPATGTPTWNTLDEGSGWLVDLKWHDTNGKAPLIVDSVTVVRASEYTGDKTALYWLPTERTARALVDYIKGDGHLPASFATGGGLPDGGVRVVDGGNAGAGDAGLGRGGASGTGLGGAGMLGSGGTSAGRDGGAGTSGAATTDATGAAGRGGAGDAGTGGGAGGASAAGGNASGTTTGAGGAGAAMPDEVTSEAAGCACRVQRGGAPATPLVLLLLAGASALRPARSRCAGRGAPARR